MTLDEFIHKWLGEKIDFDGYYGGQCVDLYRQYVEEVLGYPQSPGVGGASEIWNSADPAYYDFIKNEPLAIPQKGDILIWNRKVGGGFGHVAIFLNGDVNKFISLDQNWPTLNKVTKTEHDYKSVIGWLRPKKSVVDEKKYTEKEYQKLEEQLVKEKQLHEITRDEVRSLRADVDEQKTIAKSRKEEYEKLIEEAAKRLFLPTTSDKSDVLGAIERLLEIEDQLNQANKKLDKQQLEFQKKESGWKTEIEELKGLLNKANIRINAIEQEIEESKQQQDDFNWFKNVLGRINKLLGKKE